MSTSYILIRNKTISPLTTDDIAKMREFGLEVSTDEKHHLTITDGENFLWGYPNEDGAICGFERWGANRVDGILALMAVATQGAFVSEHDDEWDFFMDEQDDENAQA